MHRVYLQSDDQTLGHAGSPLSGASVDITGPEAEHAARVKRLEAGERVELLDGRGTVLRAVVERAGKMGKQWTLTLRIEARATVARVRPRVEVWSATPKGARVDELIEGLSQVGAASWTPLVTERGVVSPRDSKLDRLGRLAWEASKQCGRAWMLEIGRERPFAEAVAPAPDTAIVIAHAGGMPYAPTGAQTIRLLIGPEGGWSDAELRIVQEAGAHSARFGPHVMRIETAAVVSAAVVLDQEGRVAPFSAASEAGPGDIGPLPVSHAAG